MKKANKLGSSLSPYLQQHADNPVAWYPWGPEAFADAARKNKPVFLSVGYSACHWCHVMARECFEDEEVAALMNDAFICVKVDREEMPSIDHIYMKVCIMMTGSGGWPLTIIMTPGKEPFFAATYLPKHSRGRAVGMMELIPRITDVWRNQQEKIDRITGRVSEAVREPITRLEVEGPRAQWLQDTYDQLSGMFQGDTGGFGPAPKFPSPHHIMYLLRYHHRNRSDHALSMALKNLDAMRAGGIYDHVGSGFHRYATDALWHIPHFEKMLYDQALLVMAYTEAFLVTGQGSCRRTSTAVIDYVLRDMRSENGLFFSSQDADVQGEEGGYYLWTEQELQSVLSSDDYRVFSRVFAVEPGGNFPEGREKRRNILFMRDTLEDAALELGMDAGNLEEEVERILSVLLQERSTRARPHRDEKILTDWNGLMIAALAKAGAALGIPEYVRAAEQAAVFILENLSDDQGRLMHLYRGGRTAHRAGLDDYAFLVWGLIELYEATFRMIHLDEALRLTGECISLFWDERKGAFFLTPNDAETVMVRPLEFTDNAVPSGNSVSLYNMVRLAHLTGDMSLEDRGAAIARACSHQISSMPAAESFMMIGVDFLLGPPYEIVIAGNPAQDDTVRMIGALAGRFIPDSVIVLAAKGESGKAPEIARDKKPLDGKAAAYVCRGQTCTLPMTDPNEVLNILAPQG